MENPIRYSDLIAPDDSIEKLIGQLESLQEIYTNMAEKIQSEAKLLAEALSKVSGATEEGKNKIKQTNEATDKLEKAYKRLDEAMSANGKEIQRLNQVKSQYVKYQKNIAQRGKEEIRTMEQIKNASYNQLSAQYALNKAYLNSLTASDKRIKKNRELMESTRQIYEQMKKYQAETGKMQLNVGNYPQIDTKAILGSLIGVTSATAAAVTAINALKGGITVAMDFEHAASGLAAILGTTKDQIVELTTQSRELGATTVFTAQEVVELQTELAKLGYSVGDIIKMAPSVLSFAQATGSSLADAASLTGAALRMFEKDTTSTADFVDKMTAATTKSALSFSYLNNALSTVSPVANAFGFNLEDVLALLGQLANAGFDASSAATATRNILLNLADSSGKLAVALGEPVKDLDGLINGLKTLNDRGIDLAESLDLTDKRSVAAFNTFLAGTDTVLDLRDALNDCSGAAAGMAKTMGDDLAGDVKTLQSAWQDLMIEINNGQGILRTAVQWITKLVRAWRDYLSLPGWGSDKKDLQDYALRNVLEDDSGSTVQTPPSSPQPAASDAGGGNVKPTRKKTKGNKSAQNAAKQALREQEQQQKESLELRRKYEDALTELITDADSREFVQMENKYNREIQDLQLAMEKKKQAKKLSVEDEEIYNKQIETLAKIRDAKLNELATNQDKKSKEQLKKKEREQEQIRVQSLRRQEQTIEAQYDIEMSEIDMLETSEKEKTRMRLEAEKKRLQALLALYKADGKKLTEEEIKAIEKSIESIDKQIEKNNKSGDIYDMLGLKLSNEQKESIDTALQYAMDSVSKFMDLYVKAADEKRRLADEAVDSAKSTLEAEIEARNNGYANEVETARKEYEAAKKQQEQAIKQQKKAQQAQEAIDTATQVSSLITATAEIWKAHSGIPFVGTALAIAATALMWGAFAAAKIKAHEVAGSGTESYGEGTVQMLEGGSHQSGNDIDLGRKPDGTRRRAEGGEFFAVINKRNSRRYKGVIPDVINSLNNGTFAEKYINAYDGGAMTVLPTSGTNLTRVEAGIDRINGNLEKPHTYTDGRGKTIMIYKNLKRTTYGN